MTKAIATYLGIYALSLGAFWLLPTIDALGYSLVFLWLVQPLAIFAISLHIVRIEHTVHFVWALPLFFGIAFCLLPYLTFDLANTLHFGTVHAPSISFFIVGALISGAGSALGLLLANKRSRR